MQTAAVVWMLSSHRQRGTWSELVDAYIALTEFSRQKFLAAGLPGDRLWVKPNFVAPDPGPRQGEGDYALFVGRLDETKGVRTVLRAWRHLGDVPLKIVGEGPLASWVRSEITHGGLSAVQVLGWRPPSEVLDHMRGARCLVFPSESYETFGRTLVEAFACSLPPVAANLGAAGEIVSHGQTGLHFCPGDADDLAQQVRRLWEHPEEAARMGAACRQEYLARYTADVNYQQLMRIYDVARCRRANGMQGDTALRADGGGERG